MGAAFLLPIRRVETLHPDPGRWYALDDAIDALPLGEADLSEPLRLWVGNEGHGWQGVDLPKGVQRLAIPVHGVESLNAAVAGWFLSVFSSLVLAGLFLLAFRFPGALGGWMEPSMALLFPLLLLDGLFKGRHAFWTWVSLLAGLVVLYLWVPQTLASKGGLPFDLALLQSSTLTTRQRLSRQIRIVCPEFTGHFTAPPGVS